MSRPYLSVPARGVMNSEQVPCCLHHAQAWFSLGYRDLADLARYKSSNPKEPYQDY